MNDIYKDEDKNIDTINNELIQSINLNNILRKIINKKKAHKKIYNIITNLQINIDINKKEVYDYFKNYILKINNENNLFINFIKKNLDSIETKNITNMDDLLLYHNKKPFLNKNEICLCDIPHFECIKEVDANLFGHGNMIYCIKSNKLPGLNEKNKNSLTLDYYKELERLWDNNEIFPMDDQKKYINIIRYVITTSKDEIYPPLFTNYEDSKNPTLTITLFIDYGNLYTKNTSKFIYKYSIPQIKLILAFKYHFPEGNIIIYYDKVMLDAFENGNYYSFNLGLDSLDNEFDNYKNNSKFFPDKDLIDFIKNYKKMILSYYSVHKYNNILLQYLICVYLAANSSFINKELLIKYDGKEHALIFGVTFDDIFRTSLSYNYKKTNWRRNILLSY